MDSTLHVLNGDATVPEFGKSGIKGDVVVWREALSDGPVSDPIHSDAFWNKREQFIGEAFGGDQYAIKMLAERDRLKDLSQFQEVILWFEYDLFCQVNMLACLSFIDHPRISLICPGDELGERLQGLGEIQVQNFITLYGKRLHLTPEDIAFAKSAWRAYTAPSPGLIKSLENSETFKHLKPALEAHLQRLPGENGLNQIEMRMLGLIQSGVDDERQLIGTMLREQGYLGLGDLQYFHYLKGIRSLVGNENLKVNELGNSILKRSAVFEQPKQYIGGVFRPDFYRSNWG